LNFKKSKFAEDKANDRKNVPKRGAKDVNEMPKTDQAMMTIF